MFTDVWVCLTYSPLSPVGWWKFKSGSPSWVKAASCCLRLTRIWGSTPAASLLPVQLYHLPLLLHSRPRQNKSRRQPQVAGYDSYSWGDAESCCAVVAIIQAGPGWCYTQVPSTPFQLPNSNAAPCSILLQTQPCGSGRFMTPWILHILRVVSLNCCFCHFNNNCLQLYSQHEQQFQWFGSNSHLELFLSWKWTKVLGLTFFVYLALSVLLCFHQKNDNWPCLFTLF